MILDSDVFIAASRRYYSFEICPGFWHSLEHHQSVNSLRSIDKVRDELMQGIALDDLVDWIQSIVPRSFFLDTRDQAVQESYSRISDWIDKNEQFYRRAKTKFASGADGWLTAYAIEHECRVVTNEQSHPRSKAKIFIPDVCAQFQVPYLDTFAMLKELKIHFSYR